MTKLKIKKKKPSPKKLRRAFERGDRARLEQLTGTADVMAFWTEAHDDLVTDLTRFNSETGQAPPPKVQLDDLSAMMQTMTMMAARRDIVSTAPTSEPQLYAFSLDVGCSKTRSAVSFCATNIRRGSPYTVVVLAERVAELIAFRKALLEKEGVTQDDVAIWFRKKPEHDCDPDSVEDCRKARVLLATHQKGERDEQFVSTMADGKDRDLIIYDESLFTADASDSFNLSTLQGALGWIAKKVGKGEARLAYDYLVNLLGVLEADLQRQRDGGHPRALKLPGRPRNVEAERLEESAAALLRRFPEKKMAAERRAIRQTLKVVDMPVRIVLTDAEQRDEAETPVVTFNTIVPESWRRVVVLDASHHLRPVLNTPGGRIKTLSRDRFRGDWKGYADVTVYRTRLRSSKSNWRREVERGTQSPFVNAVLERLSRIPDEESAVVWIPIAEAGDKATDLQGGRHEQLLRDLLERAGIDTHRADGTERIYLRTWGRHRATNDLRHCQHAVFTCLQYLSPTTVAGMFLGEHGDLGYAFDPKEVRGAVMGEVVSDLYQAIGRINVRTMIVETCQAPRASIWLPLPPQFNEVSTRLKAALPGVNVEPWNVNENLTEVDRRVQEVREVLSIWQEMGITSGSKKSVREEVDEGIGVKASDRSWGRVWKAVGEDTPSGWTLSRNGFSLSA